VARQTRAQRRARREQQAASEMPAAPRGRTRQMAVRPAPEPAVAAPARGQQRGGVRRFISESWGELQKVEWPTQNQLIQGVVVVIVACVVVGVFLWGADLVFKRLVENVLLR
jgi:preprotein translocase subunit SecE